MDGLVQGNDRVDLLLRQAVSLDRLGRRDVAKPVLDGAPALADRGESAARRAKVRVWLGYHLTCVMSLEDAKTRLTESRDIAREAGLEAQEMRALGSLGNVLWNSGRASEALEQLERSLDLARQIADPNGQLYALLNLGVAFLNLSRFDEALSHSQVCLALARETGNRLMEAHALGNLGNLDQSLGKFAQARDHPERCLTLAGEMGDRRVEGIATGNQGMSAWALGCLALDVGEVELLGRRLRTARDVLLERLLHVLLP